MEGESLIEHKFTGSVRPLTMTDVDALRQILEHWIRNPEKTEPRLADIDKVQEVMRASVRGENTREYRVAIENDRIVGVMGFKIPDPSEPDDGQKMLEFATTDNPVEFINAYVDTSRRLGKGVGKALFKALEERAREKRFKEILVNSGPNFKDSGWAFWDGIMGPNPRPRNLPADQLVNAVGWATDMYGPGIDAPVWRKSIR